MVSTIKCPDFIVLSGSENPYGLIIDKYQSYNKPNLILKNQQKSARNNCGPRIAGET
jgi:hypothetical protein